jgi:hypothetical protein
MSAFTHGEEAAWLRGVVIMTDHQEPDAAIVALAFDLGDEIGHRIVFQLVMYGMRHKADLLAGLECHLKGMIQARPSEQRDCTAALYTR